MTRIYLSSPDIGELEEGYVLDAIRSGWVAPLGPHVDNSWYTQDPCFMTKVADEVIK